MDRTDVIDRYTEDGYVIFRDVLSSEVVERANRHVDSLLAANPELRPEDLGHELARRDPVWFGLVSEPALLDIAGAFLGPNIALFATHYICKPPRTGRAVRWHQDGAFWPLDPPEVITAWVAVTDSAPDNGCVRVIPGSHRLPVAEMQPVDGDAVLSEEIAVDVDEDAAVDLVLAPGDVSVHHPSIHHASQPNTSDRWRRGLTARYIPTSTRITDPAAASPFLLRGVAQAGVNDYLDAPASPHR